MVKVKLIKIIHVARICIPHVTNEEYAKINQLIIFMEKELCLQPSGRFIYKIIVILVK